MQKLMEAIVRAWGALTQGELLVVWPQEAKIAEQNSWPNQVREAVSGGHNLRDLQIDDSSWWVQALHETDEQAPVLVAQAKRSGEWGGLLQTWQILLAETSRERHVSQGLAEELVKAWDRLSFLYELTQIAGRSTHSIEMLQSIVDSLAQVVPAAEVFLATEKPLGRQLVKAAGKIAELPEVVQSLVREQDRTLSSQDIVELLGSALPEPLQGREMILAPVATSQGQWGVLGFLDPVQGVFDASDMQLLASVAEQIGALLEASQARQIQEEQERLARELSMAAEIQVSLLPLRLPQPAGCEVSAYLRPARQVGGDFYDIAPSAVGAPFMLLADVAGKGMPAALLTAIVHATFHSEAPYYSDPAELLKAINKSLYADLDKAQAFVTAAILRLEQDPIQIHYASAGHVDAALWRDGQHQLHFLPATCVPLGVKKSLACECEVAHLKQGDCFWLYSDGVTEAQNDAHELFGAEGLSDIIRAVHPAKAHDQVNTLVEAVEAFCWGLPLQDDIAVVALRVQPRLDNSLEVVLPFVLPAKSTAIPKVVQWVNDQIGSSTDSVAEKNATSGFALAFSEVLANQVEHAYDKRRGVIVGVLTVDASGWGVDLYDRGLSFEHDLGRPYSINLEDPPLHGYGLRLVQGLTDMCAYQRLSHGQNHWRLYAQRPGRGE